MFAPINPHTEEKRAQAVLSSLTDHKKAVDLFAPKRPQVEMNQVAASASQNDGWSVNQLFKAISLNRRTVVTEKGQQSGYSEEHVTASI